MFDIIIVGAGPAGLTSALYALRANKKVLIFEAKSYGGQITNAHLVENYPGILKISGFDFATLLYNQVKDLGGEIKYETVIRIDAEKNVTSNSGSYQAKAIILATGADNRKLGVEREAEFVGKGVSYCATCDGNFYKNKIVAIIGGGNTAVEDAIYLSNIAKKVYLIHRRDELRADEVYQKELREKENVELLINSVVTRLNGETKIESIDIKNSDESTRVLMVDGVFIAVGQEPKNEIFKNVVSLNDKGYILSEDGVHTSTSGIYVAGDARVKNLRQLTTAVADGAIAATTAIKEMK